jgi:hypothetical protein
MFGRNSQKSICPSSLSGLMVQTHYVLTFFVRSLLRNVRSLLILEFIDALKSLHTDFPEFLYVGFYQDTHSTEHPRADLVRLTAYYVTINPAPYTLHPYTPTPCTHHPAPYILHPTPCTLHPAPLHPTPCTL